MNLTKTCGEITRENMGSLCNSKTKAGYPKFIMYASQNESIPTSGDLPTATEVQTFLDTGKAVIIPVATGAFKKPALQTIEGAETETELLEVTREDNGLTAKFKRVYTNFIQMFAQNNLNNQVAQMWVIDSNDQLHGGKNGFTIPLYIERFQHAGFGQDAFVDIDHNWEVDPDIYIPWTNPDVAFKSLTNYISEGTYTETVVATYVLGQVTGYNLITGWSKTTNPTVYAKIDTNVITFYPTNSDRTSGTNALASCDSGNLPLIIVEANSSGWGGELDQVSNAIIDASTWNIAFSE